MVGLAFQIMVRGRQSFLVATIDVPRTLQRPHDFTGCLLVAPQTNARIGSGGAPRGYDARRQGGHEYSDGHRHEGHRVSGSYLEQLAMKRVSAKAPTIFMPFVNTRFRIVDGNCLES